MNGALAVMVVIAAIIWYHRADPLIDNGLTVYTDPVGNYKVYTIEVVNRSESDIDIQSVTVNGEKMPNRVLSVSKRTFLSFTLAASFIMSLS